MKIKNFMVETKKEPKKHSYNAKTIMENVRTSTKSAAEFNSDNHVINEEMVLNDDLIHWNDKVYKRIIEDEIKTEEDLKKVSFVDNTFFVIIENGRIYKFKKFEPFSGRNDDYYMVLERIVDKSKTNTTVSGVLDFVKMV